MKETRHTIEVKKVTRERLKEQGHKGESYDTLLNRLMDQIKDLEMRMDRLEANK